jgi:hypothetical protein
MAEIGFVTFARVALAVGRAALPAYRRKFSERQLTQPQLLAVLCLMRDEDWTFREAALRLAEHRELREAVGLPVVPDDTTLYRFLRRLTEEALAHTLRAVVHRVMPEMDGPATVAVEATGLTPGAIRTFFVKRIKDRAPGVPWRHGLPWPMAIDVDRRVILAQTARRGPTNDGAPWRPLVDAAHPRVSIARVLADAACDRERQPQHIRAVLQAQRILPAKRGGADWRMQGVRAQRPHDVPAPLYRRRSRIERLIAAVTRQRSARAPGRTRSTPCLQALPLGLADHRYRL